MAGFQQGTAIGIGGAAGALGDALKGFVEGREIRQQGEESKARIADEKAKVSETMADRFRTQLRANPSLAQNPNYLKILNHAGGQYGFDVPMLDGQLDINAFAPKESFQSHFSDPKSMQEFQALSPEAQHTMAAQYDTTGVQPGLIGKQVLPTTPGEVMQAMRSVSDQFKLLPEGKATIGSLDSTVAAFKQYLPGVDTDAILNADPAVLGKLSADAEEHIQWMKDHGIAVKDTAEAALKNAHSLADFRSWQHEHFQQMDSVARGRLQETIRNDNLHHQDAIDRAHNASQRIADAKAGKLGLNPVAAAKTDIQTIRETVSALNQSYNSLQRQAKALNDEGTDIPPELKEQMDSLQGQIQHWTGAMQQAQAALPAIENAALKSAGGPDVVPGGAGDGGAGGGGAVQHFVTIAQSLPKAQRLQALTSSQAFKKLSPGDKAAVAKAVQAMP